MMHYSRIKVKEFIKIKKWLPKEPFNKSQETTLLRD